MNVSIIRRILGYVLLLEAALLLLPCIVAIIYGEKQGMAYIVVSAMCALVGLLMAIKKPKNNVFYLKEGCVATALSWIVLSLFGSIPFVLTKEIPFWIDALFETVSGFTTTGASILSDVEGLSRCSLFWRTFTHWIGGMGILVFLLAIVSLSGGSNINLMKAESPGPSVGKIVPKMRHTARYLYMIYIALSVAELIFLLIGKMSLLDALMIVFGTAGTGGFGIKNDSMASFSPYIQWVVIIFMTMFGINFNAYFLILTKKFKKAFSIEEVRWYLIIIVSSSLIIFYNLNQIHEGGFTALTESVFQVTSIITTTGYTTANYDLWPQMAKAIILVLMFVGACAGSTGGGIKVSRFMVVIKTFFKELQLYIHPKSIKKIKIDGKPVEHEVVRATNVYFITVILVFGVSFLLLSFQGNDMVSNFTAVLTTLDNVGPGLAKDGPTLNFEFFNPFSKCVLIFDMLAGRLELFPLLILVNPTLWKETIKQSNTNIRRTHRKKKI